MDATHPQPGWERSSELLGVLLCVWCVTVARAGDAPLNPVWTAHLPEQIEWAEAVGPRSRPVLLVATAAGKLHVLDARSGDGLTQEPLAAGRGVRLAEGNAQSPDVVCCFDRHAVYCLKVTPPAGMRWRSGHAPSSDDYPGDPEGLSQRIGVSVTPDGVLVVDSDGRVRLLDPADGSERHAAQLRPLAAARLLTSASLAAIVSPAGDTARVLFVEPRAGIGLCAAYELPIGWPIWGRLIGRDLVLLAPPQVVVQPRDDPRRTWSLDVPTIRAAAVDVYVPPGYDSPCATTTAADSRPSGVVLIVGSQAHIRAYDALSGKSLWTCGGAREDGKLQSITVEGNRFAAVYDNGVLAGDAVSGRVLTTWEAQPHEHVIAWHFSERELWMLFHAASDAQTGLHLVRSPLPAVRTDDIASRGEGAQNGNPNPSPFQGEKKEREVVRHPDEFRLKGPARPRAVLWTPGQVVVVETSSLCAFDLP